MYNVWDWAFCKNKSWTAGKSVFKTEPTKKVQNTCDSGYQDKNGSVNLFPPMESENVNEVLKKIERYNRLKEAELCCEIQKAQIQVF